ncbi:AI-2E family transporter [cyanobacterium TDX16]|nr:AI-2E family transporter [cyanobacterium TDX16]
MRRSASWQRLAIYGLSGPVIALNIWLLSQAFQYFQHTIAVLTIAAILAFLLNYPVRFFERVGFSRSQAVIVVLFLSLVLLVAIGLTLVPLVYDQTIELIQRIPDWLNTIQTQLGRLDSWARVRKLPLDLSGFSNRVNDTIERRLPSIPEQAFGVALGTLSWLIETILVVVLAFYMLLYGDRLWRGLISFLPPEIGLPFSASLQLNFQNFFLTQLLLGLFMFAALTPIFVVLNVPFALLFALLIGVAELIPFIGASLGIGTVTLLVMVQNWLLGLQVALAAIVLQQIKDNVLAPRLMGNFTGLNPIWIFIAILTGAEMGGFLGAIVAVPLAGTIKNTIDAIRNLRRSTVAAKITITHEDAASTEGKDNLSF